ncbi:hypothetical protein M1B72_06940 [Geomonas paludis]|uniref:Restriction endonuclease type IV Mrr domain-containing protein n=1 Tax=Geomonas paludis TaxID=2740185 RepID=A0ABY4LJX9_9BACT|nr:hypothetical protein [Geomonas paludis]UPU37436.1 hypothetical protein M1B72_06940 [Geomonas paludis]
MDTLEIIRAQISKALSVKNELVGLEAVLTHIERAECLLSFGNSSEDNHFFTDVIYRTNHAYEGILKEAYFILAEKDGSKTTPNEIEKYLLNNKVLNERVVNLLESYRRDWRNPSTHDYRLFFNGGEAFLSILSVTSFVHLLLTQVLDKIFYENELARLKPFVSPIKQKYGQEYQSLDLLSRVDFLLKTFDGKLQIDDGQISLLSEREFLQGIVAHINSIDGSLKVMVDQPIEGQKDLRPDLLLETAEGKKAIVELKVYKNWNETIMHQGLSQLVTYMTKTNVSIGFLVVLPRHINSTTELASTARSVYIGNNKYQIRIIHDKAVVL